MPCIRSTQLAVQHGPAAFRSIEGPLGPADLTVTPDTLISWEFEGLGLQHCFVDGRLWQNSWGDTCQSPLHLNIQDKRNHTLRVQMQARMRQAQ